MNDRQQTFVEHYLTNGLNATQAAKMAGYSEHSAKWQGYALLREPGVRAAIDEALAARRMSAEEILARLEDQARGDWGELLDESGNIDIPKAIQNGKTHLIKAVTRETTQHGERVRVELHDSQRALALLMKPHGLNQVVIKDEREDQLGQLLRGLVAPWAVREGEAEG
jgi:phage terminase small subunit